MFVCEKNRNHWKGRKSLSAVFSVFITFQTALLQKDTITLDVPSITCPGHKLNVVGFRSLHALAVFILGRGIAAIPHFHNKSSKLSDIVRDKSPTLDHIAVLFKIRLIFHTLGRFGSQNINKMHTGKRTF